MNIVEEIEKVVIKTKTKLNRPIYYLYGHPQEITQRLQALSDNPVNSETFPLIVCFTDIPVDRNQPLGFYGRARLQIIIANSTEQHLTAPERMAKNFKPILQPICKEFLRQINRHPVFSFEEMPEYREIERFFWGRTGLYGNEGNTFNDYLDAIEIQNLDVIVKNDYCFSSKNF